LLIFSPGLTGLQNRPDRCPSARTVFVQIHTFGDGASSLENRGRRRMVSGEEADVRAWIAGEGLDRRPRSRSAPATRFTAALRCRSSA
jgi:hypothetical protein